MITAEKKPPAEPGTKSRLRHLNEHLFTSLRHARHLITAWRDDYNRNRPHSALGNIPPAEFAMKIRLEMMAA
jgi:putative transposase